MRKIGTSTIITNGNRVLIGRRGPACKRGHGLYSFPGGKLDDGESIIQSAAREVYEETGLVVAYQERQFEIACLTVTDHFPHQDKLTIWLTARYTGGEPVNREPSKCYGWKWYTLDWIAKNIPQTKVPGTEEYYWIPFPLIYHHVAPLLE